MTTPVIHAKPKFLPSIIVLENRALFRNLVASTAGLGDDTLELVDLSLGTAEGTELKRVSKAFVG